MMDYSNIYGKYEKYRAEYYPVKHRRKNLSSINVRLSPEYRMRIDSIRKKDDVLGNMMLSKDDYFKLVHDAHSQNIHWSTKVEGSPLTLAEVRRSSEVFMRTGNRDEKDPGPKQEIYNHLLLSVYKDLMKLPWDMDVVRAIHKQMVSDTGVDCEPGVIRGSEMCIRTENDQESFIACPAVHVENELCALLDWVSSSPMDPIVTAIVFFHEFESIHPFKDGNGRVGRSLFHMLMQQLGFDRFNLCILEPKLLGDTSVYYSLLEYTDSEADYTPIVEYFIDCIGLAYDEAIDAFSSKDLLRTFDENTKAIAKRARDINDWFTVADAALWVRNVGEQTVRTKLSNLVDKGVLERKGMTRSTMFRFADPLREFKGIHRQR